MESTTDPQREFVPESQPRIWSIGAKGGLYTGLVLIIFSLISFLLDLARDGFFSGIFLVVSLVIGIYLTQKAFKDDGNGYLSYSQGLGLGTIVGLVSGVLTAVFTVLYIFLIDDSFLKKQVDEMRVQFENKGFTDAQIDQAMYVSEMMMNPVALFFLTIINYVFYAFIVALIISAFTKRQDPDLVF